MIHFGVCVGPGDSYERRCRPFLEQAAAPSPRILTIDGATSIFAAFGPEDRQRTHVIRTEPATTNRGNLTRLDRVVGRVRRGDLWFVPDGDTVLELGDRVRVTTRRDNIEAIEELETLGLPIGSVIVNRNIPPFLPADDLAKAAEGDIDADAVRAALSRVGVTLNDADFAGLLTETIEHASRIRARAESGEQLDQLHVPRLELPTIADGVDLGSLYELAETLAQRGVR